MLRKLLLPIFILLPAISGCKNLSTIPTSEDNFIIVPPTNLFVLSAHDAAILIQWADVGAVGFSYYNVYYGTNKSHLNNEVQTDINDFYVDSLSYDSTYYFQVTAVYANGRESGPSNIVSAKPINYYVPNPPSGVIVQGHNDDSGRYLTVSWSPNIEGDLAGYEVYRGTSGDFIPDTVSLTNLVAIVKSPVYRDTTGLSVDREYYYEIIAFDFAHWRSLPSLSDSDMILRRPALVSPQNGASVSGQQLLSFGYTPVAGASGYILYVSTSPSVGDVYSATVPAGQDSVLYSGPTLNLGQQYYWHVAAVTKDPNTPNSVSGVYSFILTQ